MSNDISIKVEKCIKEKFDFIDKSIINDISKIVLESYKKYKKEQDKIDKIKTKMITKYPYMIVKKNNGLELRNTEEEYIKDDGNFEDYAVPIKNKKEAKKVLKKLILEKYKKYTSIKEKVTVNNILNKDIFSLYLFDRNKIVAINHVSYNDEEGYIIKCNKKGVRIVMPIPWVPYEVDIKKVYFNPLFLVNKTITKFFNSTKE